MSIFSIFETILDDDNINLYGYVYLYIKKNKIINVNKSILDENKPNNGIKVYENYDCKIFPNVGEKFYLKIMKYDIIDIYHDFKNGTSLNYYKGLKKILVSNDDLVYWIHFRDYKRNFDNTCRRYKVSYKCSKKTRLFIENTYLYMLFGIIFGDTLAKDIIYDFIKRNL